MSKQMNDSTFGLKFSVKKGFNEMKIEFFQKGIEKRVSFKQMNIK